MKETHIRNVPVGATLKFAWSMVRANKPMLLGMIFCAFLFAFVELSLPVIGKILFDGIAAVNITEEVNRTTVWHLTYTFFGFVVVFWVFRYGMFFVWVPFSALYIRRLVETAFDKVQTFSTAWHNDTFSGVTVRNLTRGMWALDGIMDLVLTQFLPTFLIVFGTAVYLAYSGYLFHGLALGVFILIFICTTGGISLKVVSPLNQESNDADSKLGGLIADAVTCNAAVKAFGAERYESARIREGLDVWQKFKLKAWYASTWNGVLQTTLIVVMRAGLVFLAMFSWTKGQASLGDVFYFFSITAVIQGYLRDFGSQLRSLQNHINDLDPIAAYMQMTPGIADAPDAVPLAVTSGGITFDRVTFGYKPELPPLFRDLSVALPAGKTVALVGRSGSGKSSFIKLAQRLYDVQGGRILIDGQDISKVTQESLRQSIAIVPQDPVLFHRTLAENIAYGKPGASTADVRRAAHDAFIDGFIATLPHHYDTLVGERGVKLSGGERQRVAIARAILADRPILVMDEATSSLDSLSENLIQQALEKLKAGRTTLVIAHRLSTIRDADRILVFESGQIVQQGTHEELLGRPGAYKTLYDAQVDGLIV